MRTLETSTAFRQDAKLAKRRGKSMSKLNQLVDLLVADEPFPIRCQDHALRGRWAGYRDCHIEPDWILIYQVEGETVRLARTGTHSDLFD